MSILSHSRTTLQYSKRWGTLGLVNQLFKTYFKVCGTRQHESLSLKHSLSYFVFLSLSLHFCILRSTSYTCVSLSSEPSRTLTSKTSLDWLTWSLTGKSIALPDLFQKFLQFLLLFSSFCRYYVGKKAMFDSDFKTGECILLYNN